MSFIPGVVPSSEKTESAWWFAFRGDELLVKLRDKAVTIPCTTHLESLNLKPVREQYLGTLDGRPCYSAELAPNISAPEGMAFRGLRQLFGFLEDNLFSVAGRAIQIMNWDQTHQYCGRCGSSTENKPNERAKVCPQCGLLNFPRISPAVIVAVLKGNRILLTHAHRLPPGLYSVIAGFVEPGETLEECVSREVKEEVGIEVKNIRYFGSQPWPFPNSLMVAFTAVYARGKINTNETEIIDAGWFTADNLPLIPDKISISRRLIDWFVETYQ
ncbi:MAG: NAD(+) diphosphatase [bacterium]